MNAVTVNNLTKIYKKGEQPVYALNNVSLSFEKGSFTAITGTSGSGKSTFLHILAGIDNATSGEVMIDDVKITELKRDKMTVFRRKNIGLIYQFFNLVSVLTVEENIVLPSTLDGNAIDSGRLDKLLEQLHLEPRRKHYPSELSGGQQQRVAIARAIYNGPSIVLADEPTGNLDSANRKDVLDALKTLHLSDGYTVKTEDNSLYSEPLIKEVSAKNGSKVVIQCTVWDEICDILPCYKDRGGCLLIFPDTTALLSEQTMEYGRAYIYAGDHKSICEFYQGDGRIWTLDYAANFEQVKTLMFVISFFLYLFMGLVFFVCFINMFFTVYSNHKLREKDYLVLQTLGMIPKQTRKMVLIECLKSCIYTVIVGCIGTVLTSEIAKRYAGIYSTIPVFTVVIVILLVVLAHYLSYVVVSRQISKINMLEGIRNYQLL